MKLHHIGIVVRDLGHSGRAYEGALGLVAASRVFLDPIQNVRLQFWRARDGSYIELIEPAGKDSPVWREAQKGGGLNHLCFETSDIGQTIDDSVQKGAMVVRPPAPAVAFGGQPVAFLYFLDLGLLEFVESPHPLQLVRDALEELVEVGAD
jgi:methylmalonyl-CoA/ethylmalonyl-CoA epimerase